MKKLAEKGHFAIEICRFCQCKLAFLVEHLLQSEPLGGQCFEGQFGALQHLLNLLQPKLAKPHLHKQSSHDAHLIVQKCVAIHNQPNCAVGLRLHVETVDCANGALQIASRFLEGAKIVRANKHVCTLLHFVHVQRLVHLRVVNVQQRVANGRNVQFVHVGFVLCGKASVEVVANNLCIHNGNVAWQRQVDAQAKFEWVDGLVDVEVRNLPLGMHANVRSACAVHTHKLAPKVVGKRLLNSVLNGVAVRLALPTAVVCAQV